LERIVREIVAANRRITGAAMTRLETGATEAFLEIHRGVVTDSREACRPRDAVVAKLIRPKSIRALFGDNARLSTSSLFWNKEEKIRPSVGKTRNVKRAMAQQKVISTQKKSGENSRREGKSRRRIESKKCKESCDEEKELQPMQ
jgi:hypothetical protein